MRVLLIINLFFSALCFIELLSKKAKLLTDNGEAARDACINGLDITISSNWCCHEQLKSGELSNTAIWAVYPSSRLLARKVRVFIDYFLELFGDKPYWEEGA